MIEELGADVRDRLRSVAFEELSFFEQVAAQVCLIAYPGTCTELLHPGTVKRWLDHCAVRQAKGHQSKRER